MKNRFLLIGFFLCFGFAVQAQTAQQFDHQVGKIVDSLMTFITAKPEQNMLALANGSYDGYKSFDARMLAFTANNETIVKNMPDVRNSRSVRMALINLLVFEHRVMMTEIAVFDKQPADAAGPVVSKALNAIPDNSDAEDTYRNTLISARSEYGKENGFIPFTES